jgi:hypothetical protein
VVSEPTEAEIGSVHAKSCAFLEIHDAAAHAGGPV